MGILMSSDKDDKKQDNSIGIITPTQKSLSKDNK